MLKGLCYLLPLLLSCILNTGAINVTWEDDNPNIHATDFIVSTDDWAGGPGFFSGGTQLTSGNMDSVIEFTFTGTAFTIFGDRFDDHGMFDIVLDGKQFAEGSAYLPITWKPNATEPQRSIIYASPLLEKGSHTVMYKNAGKKAPSKGSFMTFDFVVLQLDGPSAPKPASHESSSVPSTSKSGIVAPSSRSESSESTAVVAETSFTLSKTSDVQTSGWSTLPSSTSRSSLSSTATDLLISAGNDVGKPSKDNSDVDLSTIFAVSIPCALVLLLLCVALILIKRGQTILAKRQQVMSSEDQWHSLAEKGVPHRIIPQAHSERQTANSRNMFSKPLPATGLDAKSGCWTETDVGSDVDSAAV